MVEAVRKPRGRPVKSSSEPDGATRDRLIDATGELMANRGSVDVTFADIAKATELNPALISYYFGNKAGLMMALLRRVLGESLTNLEDLAREDVPPEEKLRVHIHGLISTYFRYPYINPLIHQLVIDEPQTFGPMIAEEFSRRAAGIQKHILDEGVAAGRFRDVDPLNFYFHIVGACDQFFHGRYQMRHIFGIANIDERRELDYADYLADSLVRGLAT